MNPSGFVEIETCEPVVAVKELVEHKLLLLLTPWAITAVGADGVQWTTDRIAIEGIYISEVSNGKIIGVSDPEDDARDFVVELSTGRLTGGAGVPR